MQWTLFLFVAVCFRSKRVRLGNKVGSSKELTNLFICSLSSVESSQDVLLSSRWHYGHYIFQQEFVLHNQWIIADLYSQKSGGYRLCTSSFSSSSFIDHLIAATMEQTICMPSSRRKIVSNNGFPYIFISASGCMNVLSLYLFHRHFFLSSCQSWFGTLPTM